MEPGLLQKAIAPEPASTPQQPTRLPPELAGLTAREREVLALIVSGASNH
ncbi:hypothetical protein [Microseira wollei]|nr:hypothetical protein [Microseira wollei]